MNQWQTVVVVISVLAWWLSPPTSLGDLSRREALRRQLAPRAVRVLTNQDVPEPPPGARAAVPASSPDAAGAANPTATAERPDEKAATAAHDEAWWRAKVTAAREALERDQLLAEAMQSRINALTNEVAARDDPAQRSVLVQQRVRALAELERLKQTLAADRAAIDGLGEEARKQNVPPGWIR